MVEVSEMQPRKQIFVITVLLLLCTTNFFVIFNDKTVSAASVGSSTLYFVDYFENTAENSGYLDSSIPISEFPPSKTNNSYYPPILRNIATNYENYFQWITFWVLNSIDYYGAGLDGYEDIIDQLKILMPNPLRITESYINENNESIMLDGDVTYNLDFSTSKFLGNENENKVNVSIYSYNPNAFFPTLIKSTETIITEPSSLSKIHSQTIIIENVTHTIVPGSSILFSIEIIPANKTILSFIQNQDSFINKHKDQMKEFLIKVIEFFDNPEINAYYDIYKDFENLTSSLNLSSNLTAEFFNSVIGPSLVYDSIDHPSSVTVPFQSSNEKENTIKYYLDQSNKLTKSKPTGDPSSSSLANGQITWRSDSFARSKILKNADAVIYINYKDATFFKNKMAVTALLLINNELVASDSVQFENQVFVTTSKIYHFSFDNLEDNIEISYDDTISIQLELENETTVGQGLLRSVDVLYNGLEYPSYLMVSLSETDHITVTYDRSPSSAEIIPGDTVTYTLNISSDYNDDITVDYKPSSFSDTEQNSWDITISDPSFSIQSDGKKSITVDLTSTFISLDAYDEKPLEMDLEIIGKTGYDSIPLSAEVSSNAVTFDTLIDAPEGKTIKHGANQTYVINITNNNTGLWPNSFILTALSSNNWTVDLSDYTYDNLGYGNTTSIDVTLHVPKKTNVDSDMITFKVISKENGAVKTITINSTIKGESIFEDIFDYFETLAEDFGLDEVFGDFAPFVIPILLIIVIFIIIILMVFIITSKTIELICVDRIKEILPYEKATYDIIIKNHSNKIQTCNLDIHFDSNDEKWKYNVQQETVTIPQKQSKTIHLSILPTDEIIGDDWVKASFIASIVGSKKQRNIDLMVMVKNGITDLSIQNVFHWPKPFRGNEKVTTSFKIQNNGNIQAKNIKVRLLINDKEKNKVEDIIIPARGYADISIPWIAKKGKNDIRIVVT